MFINFKFISRPECIFGLRQNILDQFLQLQLFNNSFFTKGIDFYKGPLARMFKIRLSCGQGKRALRDDWSLDQANLVHDKTKEQIE